MYLSDKVLGLKMMLKVGNASFGDLMPLNALLKVRNFLFEKVKLENAVLKVCILVQ